MPEQAARGSPYRTLPLPAVLVRRPLIDVLGGHQLQLLHCLEPGVVARGIIKIGNQNAESYTREQLTQIGCRRAACGPQMHLQTSHNWHSVPEAHLGQRWLGQIPLRAVSSPTLS